MNEDKKKNFFSHDVNASHDPKLIALIADYGMEGYGFYWIMIEMLHDQGGYIKRFPKLADGIAHKIRSKPEAVLKQIEALLHDYELLLESASGIYSPRVLANLEFQKFMSDKKSEAGRKGGINSGKKRNTKQPLSKTKHTFEANEANEAHNITLNNITLNKILSTEDTEKLSTTVDNFVNNIKVIRPSFDFGNLNTWKEAFFDLHRIDQRPISEIDTVINFIKNDKFWSKTVLSIKSLKENFDQLVLKSSNDKIPFKKTEHEKPLLENCVKNILTYTNGSMGCEIKDKCQNSYNGYCLAEQAIKEVKKRKGVKV
ncbi:MAG: DUF4373 domain-containing protein [Deltaproteobacteria bacterium]|nr:DUF4373 domain-containing protein [Deltaproteobacteria bacterium]